MKKLMLLATIMVIICALVIVNVAFANLATIPASGLKGFTTDTSVNLIFFAETSYDPPTGFKATAEQLSVFQRYWKVLPGDDDCVYARRRTCINCNATSGSELPDVLPANNNPLQIYYATRHKYRIIKLPNTGYFGEFHTSPNNGIWGNASYYTGFGSPDACATW